MRQLENVFMIEQESILISIYLRYFKYCGELPESKAGFIHKIKLAIKEIEEVFYGLNLCRVSGSYPDTLSLLE